MQYYDVQHGINGNPSDFKWTGLFADVIELRILS